jgi:hypothetical protein
VAELSPRDRAHRGFTMVLQRMPHGKATAIAKEMSISDSTLTELKKQVEPVLLLLAHLGLKTVDTRARCMAPAAFDFLTQCHQRLMVTAPALVWGDEESTDTGFPDTQSEYGR